MTFVNIWGLRGISKTAVCKNTSDTANRPVKKSIYCCSGIVY